MHKYPVITKCTWKIGLLKIWHHENMKVCCLLSQTDILVNTSAKEPKRQRVILAILEKGMLGREVQLNGRALA